MPLETLEKLWTPILSWGEDHLSAVDTFIQLGYSVFGFSLAALLYSLIRKPVHEWTDSLEIPSNIKRAVQNTRRLIFYIFALCIIGLSSLIANEVFALDITLSTILMKLMLAWIGIRLFLQFVTNSFMRNIATISTWTIAALSIFGILDETIGVLDSIGFSIGDFKLSALIVIKSALALFFLLYIATFLSHFIERRVFQSKSLKRSSQVLIAKIIRIALITVAVLIGITSAGIDLSVFAVLSGAIGLGIGFGLQKVVSNLFSGLLLLMDQSIQPGDVIEIENSGTFGWVNNMAARYTEIVTRDNKSYLIPNEEFITQRVVNWSHGNKFVRLEVPFGVHYDSDPHEVIAIAKEAATKPERVVSNPEPVCFLTEFGDSSINFVLRFWVRDAENGVTNIKGGVILSLWDALKDNDISIPYPHREVFHHYPEGQPNKKSTK